MNWMLFELTPARVTTAKLSVRSIAMLLGAEVGPKEICGLGPTYTLEFALGGFMAKGKAGDPAVMSVGGLGFDEFDAP